MSNARGRIAAATMDEPFVADVLVSLDEAPEEALHLRIGCDDRIVIPGFSDHDLASNDRLDSILSGSVPRQNPFAGEAQGDDLPAAGRVRLEFRENSRAHEH